MALTALSIYGAFISLIAFGMLLLSLRTYRQEIPRQEYSPRTLVIVPCRGEDLTLEENLRSLQVQDHKNYALVCAVDTARDSATKTIRKLSIEMVVADPKYKRGSGKVRAIATAIARNRGYQAYAIADSDVTFERGWLRKLTAPLKDEKYGLATAFPFFNPGNSIWSKVKCAWGMVGQGLMESKVTRFGWGGSMAFRKDFLDDKSFKLFSESLSDDIAITKTAFRKGLKIFYRADIDIRVNNAETRQTFFEWANRQTALSLLGYKNNFYFGVAFYFAQVLLLVSGIALGTAVSAVFFLLLAPFLISIVRGYAKLKAKYPEYPLISLMLPFLYLYNLFAARGMNKIFWRGRAYKLE
ncbi:MAG: glycosyltransferase family 2 protein [Candidatus Micrarchaeota archaeon]|nr:glycosyltransferase family 2 protein [Candidatus Micrarchaeota archaeon]